MTVPFLMGPLLEVRYERSRSMALKMVVMFRNVRILRPSGMRDRRLAEAGWRRNGEDSFVIRRDRIKTAM